MRSRSVVVTGMCGFLALVFAGPAIAFPRLESRLAAASAGLPSFSAAVGARVRWDALEATLLVPAEMPETEVNRIASDLAALDGATSVTVSRLPARAVTFGDGEPDTEPQPVHEVEVEVETSDVRPVQEVQAAPDLAAAQLAIESALGGPVWPSGGEPDEQALDRLATALLSLEPRISVELVGHTAGAGEATDNLLLSQREAAIMVELLVERGVDPLRLSSFGQGEAQPLVGFESTEAAARNHRIEIVLRASEGNG